MDSKEKKTLVDHIKKATNILVTVGANPSVDALSAALGLTLLLNKADKHATAVFSGQIPPAISFLEPTKTLENTLDGLRDFIIALDKDKADHLRYKLDGDVVKIFITPYKNTVIGPADLQFSQGDFNVELIIALGVDNKDDLDQLVAAHGRILHDATTVTVSAGKGSSDLGVVDWRAPSASGLSEMLANLSSSLGENLLDAQIATALLTGIVSATERFSNNLTSSEVMKTAANLMSAGANQQLIAAKLEEAQDIPHVPSLESQDGSLATGNQAIDHSEEEADTDDDGTMRIHHEDVGAPQNQPAKAPDGLSLADIEANKEQVLQEELSKVVTPASSVLEDLKEASKEVLKEEKEPEELVPKKAEVPEEFPKIIPKPQSGYVEEASAPSFGGTLNATTEQAEEDTRLAEEDDRNRVILEHDREELQETEPTPETPEPLAAEPEPSPVIASVPTPPVVPEPTIIMPAAPSPSGSTLADIEKQARAHAGGLGIDDAREAVANALDQSFSPANNPAESIGSRPLGDDLHGTAPVAPASPSPSPTAIELPPLPPLPPSSNSVSDLPPLPPLPPVIGLEEVTHPEPVAPPAPTANDWQEHTVEPPASNDPGQFHIPGSS